MKNTVFLDRDGVINKLVFFPDFGLIDSPMNVAQYKLVSGAADAILNFNRLGLKVIVISNQPGIAKGKMSEEMFGKIRLKMRNMLAKNNAHIDAEYYCFHHPRAKLPQYKVKCDCRKPKPGLILRAAKDFSLDTSNCYMIGDGLTDIKAGKAVGCTSVLIGEMKCDLCRQMEVMEIKPDIIAPSLLDASKIIEKEVIKNGNIH
jgi:D-glycero-D-manno-heptose 1,7-bisphosphate phosphatase